MWVVYVIQSARGILYTGITKDIIRRVRQHNGDLAGGAKATRAGRPWTLVYAELTPGRGEASRRESHIKGLTKKEKLAMIVGCGRDPSGLLN
jgi:putative endonuclease